jgi:hypothetical protein
MLLMDFHRLDRPLHPRGMIREESTPLATLFIRRHLLL